MNLCGIIGMLLLAALLQRPEAPLKLVTTLYMALYKSVYYYYYYFLTPVLNSQGMKKLRYAIKKYKNQAGMNLTPPPPSQNSYAVRWHCTAESERRVAEIKLLLLLLFFKLTSTKPQAGKLVIVATALVPFDYVTRRRSCYPRPGAVL